MWTIGGIAPPLLTSAPDGADWPTLRICRVTFREIVPMLNVLEAGLAP
jgi:hypothetical protein